MSVVSDGAAIMMLMMNTLLIYCRHNGFDRLRSWQQRLSNTKSSVRTAFTLIELLVTLGIIAILIAILLPAVQSAREAARRSQCRSHLKQLALAMHNYHETHGTFPINTSFTNDLGPLSHSRSWMQGVLPFIEQKNLHDQIDPTVSILTNRAAAAQRIALFLCMSDSHDGTMDNRADVPEPWRLGVTNYKACAGSNWGAGEFVNASVAGRFAGSTDGLNQGNGLICEGRQRAITTRMRDITDGTGTTFALGETVPAWTKWAWWYSQNAVTATVAIPLNHPLTRGQPEEFIEDWEHNYGFMSQHASGAFFAMADGSVRFVSDNINLNVYRDLGTIQGREVVGEF